VIRVLLCLLFAGGILVTHGPHQASRWLALAAAAMVALAALRPLRLPQATSAPRAPDPSWLRTHRRIRAAVARTTGRHPHLTALILLAVVAAALHHPWPRGVEALGVHRWHDCAANLLQAELLLEGRFARPALEHPESFRTLHVLVTPVYCSKYPPGYPAVMAVGLALGVVEWIPPLLCGLTVAATWWLGRRLIGRWHALLAAAGLAGCALVVDLGMLQISNTLALLLGALILGGWLRQQRRGWTYRGAGAIGLLLGALLLTRTFDAVVLGVVLMVATVLKPGLACPRARRWTAMLALGGLPGAIGLSAYHHAVTGSPLRSPYVIYETQQSYTGQFIFETVHPAPNLDRMPVNVRRFAESFTRPAHEAHSIARLPITAWRRFNAFAEKLGGPLMLLPLVVLPTAWRRRAARPIGAVALAYFGLYLVYAFNEPRYLAPLLPAIAWATAAALHRPGNRRASAMLEIAFLVLLVLGGIYEWRRLSETTLDRDSARFQQALAGLPEGERQLIFIRYGGDHSYHCELVYNRADLNSATRVYAHDLGPAANQRLINAMPGRRAWLYDEAAGAIAPLSREPPPGEP